MLWFILALTSAILVSTNDIIRKLISQKVNIVVIPFFQAFITFSVMFIFSIFKGLPEVNTLFFLVAFSNAFLNTIATILYVYALKHGDISIGIPMLSFTPAFMIVTSFILLGEFPNIFGIIGISLIVSGAYLLTTNRKPFEHLKKELSPKIFLTIALIWSITANLDKIGSKLATPEFYITCVTFMISLFLFPVVIKNLKLNEIKENLKALSGIGFVNAFALLAQMHALLLAKASYVIATKRLSTVFSTVFGGKFFREKELKKRIIAASIMFSGVFMILVFGS